VLERSPCSLFLDAATFNEAGGCVANVSGPTIPDLFEMRLAAILFKPALLSHSMKWQAGFQLSALRSLSAIKLSNCTMKQWSKNTRRSEGHFL
jgi:hypothetical protein